MSKIECATQQELEGWSKMDRYTEYWRTCCEAELIRRESKRINSSLQFMSYESIAKSLMRTRRERKERIAEHRKKRFDRISPRFRKLYL